MNKAYIKTELWREYICTDSRGHQFFLVAFEPNELPGYGLQPPVVHRVISDVEEIWSNKIVSLGEYAHFHN